jgi:hypothetical protein
MPIIKARSPASPHLLPAAAAMLLAGCAHVPFHSAAARATQPLPPSLAAYYAYAATTPQVEIELLEEQPRFRRSLVRFPLSAPDFTPTEPVIELEWFESTAPGARPAVRFSPILGGDYPLERGICRFLASHGYHVAMVHRKTLKVAPEKDAAYLELLLRQAILRNRQVVDWMVRQPGVDAERLAGYGLSMGGMATFITAAVEPRLKYHVVVLAGGSLADIICTSKDSLLTKPRARYLAHHHIDVDTMHRLLTEALTTDPIRMAPYVEPERLFMFIALADRTIGASNALRLWRAAGRPSCLFVPVGHYTAYITLPYLKYTSLRFLNERLLP